MVKCMYISHNNISDHKTFTLQPVKVEFKIVYDYSWEGFESVSYLKPKVQRPQVADN